VLRRTTSGGACVNAAAAHGALPSLPFGGIGQSGSGRHHGVEGFREFSNLRAVFVRGEGDLIDAFAPPYGPAADAVVEAAFGGATYSRCACASRDLERRVARRRLGADAGRPNHAIAEARPHAGLSSRARIWRDSGGRLYRCEALKPSTPQSSAATYAAATRSSRSWSLWAIVSRNSDSSRLSTIAEAQIRSSSSSSISGTDTRLARRCASTRGRAPARISASASGLDAPSRTPSGSKASARCAGAERTHTPSV